jgi:hypothetical protein
MTRVGQANAMQLEAPKQRPASWHYYAMPALTVMAAYRVYFLRSIRSIRL